MTNTINTENETSNKQSRFNFFRKLFAEKQKDKNKDTWFKILLDNNSILEISEKPHFPEGKLSVICEKRIIEKISTAQPILSILEESNLLREYKIDKVHEFSHGLITNFKDLYLHLSIRILNNGSIMIDSLLSHSNKEIKDGYNEMLKLQHKYGIDNMPVCEHEGIRFEPFFLREASSNYKEIKGKGLFNKGLHFPGIITPSWIHLFGFCDKCKKSFGFQSFHAGMGNQIYFYCDKGIHAFTCPMHLVPSNKQELQKFEKKLPKCALCKTNFRDSNPFRCPNCGEPYIDFRKYPKLRQQEYYGNFLPGDSSQRYKGQKHAKK